MNSQELQSIQASIKSLYNEQPSAAFFTLRAEGNLGEGMTCNVQTSKALMQAGLHPATGGTGQYVCSGNMLR